tara:strand:- start:313 stop:546 length:234 start_codon:yes stop_codon:yes gene_type:complete
MAIVKTIEDGWDCEPKLKEVVDTYENAADIIYEINNCVRVTDLCDIIEELKSMCIDMQEKLDEIDDSQEFETVDEED